MQLLSALLLGFGTGFFSGLFPGMLNMTSVSVALERGRGRGRQFAVGAGTAVGTHALLALFFASYLTAHPEVFVWLRQAAIAIFLLLAVFFLWRGLRPRVQAAARGGGRSALRFGFTLAIMNVLAIPYFFAIGSFAAGSGYFPLVGAYIPSFALAAGSGAALVFTLYVGSADYVARRASFIASNLNYLLSGLFVVLALIQLYTLIA